MTNAEGMQPAGQIENLPAGGNGIGLIIGVLLIVLLVVVIVKLI